MAATEVPHWFRQVVISRVKRTSVSRAKRAHAEKKRLALVRERA